VEVGDSARQRLIGWKPGDARRKCVIRPAMEFWICYRRERNNGLHVVNVIESFVCKTIAQQKNGVCVSPPSPSGIGVSHPTRRAAFLDLRTAGPSRLPAAMRSHERELLLCSCGGRNPKARSTHLESEGRFEGALVCSGRYFTSVIRSVVSFGVVCS